MVYRKVSLTILSFVESVDKGNVETLKKKTSQSPCQLSRYEYISNGGDKQTHKSTII